MDERSATIFIIKLILYFYLIIVWIYFIINHYQGYQIFQNQFSGDAYNGKTPSCKELCKQKYALIKDKSRPFNPMLYENKTVIKNMDQQAQFSQIINYYVDSALKGLQIDDEQTDTYSVQFFRVGCFFKEYRSSYECFEVPIKNITYQIIRSQLEISLQDSIFMFIQDILLEIFPSNLKQPVSKFLSDFMLSKGQIVFILLLIFIAVLFFTEGITFWNKIVDTIRIKFYGDIKADYKDVIKKDDAKGIYHQKLQNGIRLLSQLNNIQQQAIYGASSQFMNAITGSYRMVKDSLDLIEHKKLKLLTRSDSGVTLKTNIKSWVQKQVFIKHKELIYYDLSKQLYHISEYGLNPSNHLQNLNLILNAINNGKYRRFYNIIISNIFGFFSSIFQFLNSLLQIKLLSLIIYVICTRLFLDNGIKMRIFIILIVICINAGLIYQIYLIIMNFILALKQWFIDLIQYLKDLFKSGKLPYPQKKIIVLQDFDELYKVLKIQKTQQIKPKPLQNNATQQKITQNTVNQAIVTQLLKTDRMPQFKKLLQVLKNIQEQKIYDIILVCQNRQLAESLMRQNRNINFHYRLVNSLPLRDIVQLIQARVDPSYLKIAKTFALITNNSSKITQLLRATNMDIKYNHPQNYEYFSDTQSLNILQDCRKEMNKLIYQSRQYLDNLIFDQNQKRYLDRMKDQIQNNKYINKQQTRIQSQFTQLSDQITNIITDSQFIFNNYQKFFSLILYLYYQIQNNRDNQDQLFDWVYQKRIKQDNRQKINKNNIFDIDDDAKAIRSLNYKGILVNSFFPSIQIALAYLLPSSDLQNLFIIKHHQQNIPYLRQYQN